MINTNGLYNASTRKLISVVWNPEREVGDYVTGNSTSRKLGSFPWLTLAPITFAEKLNPARLPHGFIPAVTEATGERLGFWFRVENFIYDRDQHDFFTLQRAAVGFVRALINASNEPESELFKKYGAIRLAPMNPSHAEDASKSTDDYDLFGHDLVLSMLSRSTYQEPYRPHRNSSLHSGFDEKGERRYSMSLLLGNGIEMFLTQGKPNRYETRLGLKARCNLLGENTPVIFTHPLGEVFDKHIDQEALFGLAVGTLRSTFPFLPGVSEAIEFRVLESDNLPSQLRDRAEAFMPPQPLYRPNPDQSW